MEKKLEEQFNKKFKIMEQVDQFEVDGVFALEMDREKVLDWIDSNFISLEEMEEIVGGIKVTGDQYTSDKVMNFVIEIADRIKSDIRQRIKQRREKENTPKCDLCGNNLFAAKNICKKCNV